MTSFRLQQITRKHDRATSAAEKTQPAGDLGSAIEALIEQRVQERVSAELDRHRERLQQHNPRLRQLMAAPPMATDFAQVPEPQRTAPLPKEIPPALIHRDETGRAKWLEMGTAKFDLERDSRGRITRMVQRTEK